MPRFDIECIVVGTLALGAFEAPTLAEAEAYAWEAVRDQNLTPRLPDLRQVLIEHMMVEPARPAETEVTL